MALVSGRQRSEGTVRDQKSAVSDNNKALCTNPLRGNFHISRIPETSK
jgi:hypothetical protein